MSVVTDSEHDSPSLAVSAVTAGFLRSTPISEHLSASARFAPPAGTDTPTTPADGVLQVWRPSSGDDIDEDLTRSILDL